MDDHELTRRQTLGAGAAAGAAALAVTAPAAGAFGAGPLGIGGPDTTAMELVGQIAQEGRRLTVGAYLTSLDGAAAADLFTSPRGTRFDSAESATPSTARFTLYGVVTQSSVSVVGETVVVARAAGELGLYYAASGGATFDNLASFGAGRRIARYDGSFQNRLIVGPPAVGTLTLVGDLQQTSLVRFQAGGGSRRIGRRGIKLRLDANGRGELLDPAGPNARLYIAGSLTYVGAARG